MNQRGTIVVTRPAAQAGALLKLLDARGFRTLAFPVIAIEPLADPAVPRDAMRHLERYGLVVFVSPNAISHALAHRAAPWPTRLPIGVMGQGSVAALAEAGIARPAYRIVSPRADATLAEPRHDSEGLFDALLRVLPPAVWRGARALLVRGNGGRAWLVERLREAGIEVDEIEAYRRSTPQPSALERDAMRALIDANSEGYPPATLVVTSSEGLANLPELIAAVHPDAGAALAWLKNCTLLVPHPRIAEKARGMGFSTVLVCGSGDARIVAALE